MLLTTTDGLDGFRIERYLGVVGGESINNTWGDRKQLLHEAIQSAVDEMRRVAATAGANAVVGVHIDHEVTPARSVIAYGTAVVVRPTREPPPVLPPSPAYDPELQ